MDSGGGDNSVFANSFLSILRDNDGVLDASQLFSQLRPKVMVNSDQTPEYGDIHRAGHDGGDFLFVRQWEIESAADWASRIGEPSTHTHPYATPYSP